MRLIGRTTTSPRTVVRGLPTGRILISSAALFTGVGALVADWNETHVYNPAWPPHAKFHNAQTIVLAVTMASLSLGQLWGPGRVTRTRVRLATLFGGLFWATQVPAAFFPGAAVVDADNPVQPLSLLGIPVNQVTGTAAVILPLLAAGYALEDRRLRSLDGVLHPASR